MKMFPLVSHYYVGKSDNQNKVWIRLIYYYVTANFGYFMFIYFGVEIASSLVGGGGIIWLQPFHSYFF